MKRRIRDAVIEGYPSKFVPETLPATVPRTAAQATAILDGLRPTPANLAPSESWRRMVGGRKRYNVDRQNNAMARREAILAWLLRHRQAVWFDVLGEYCPVDRIVMRHGDGAMLARALHVGKATICRDLSALQAVAPRLFGLNCCEVTYEEYMGGWRYAHRAEMGNEQPHQNLRFPANQNGPKSRTRRVAHAATGPSSDRAMTSASDSGSGGQERGHHAAPDERRAVTPEHYLALLELHCRELDKPKRSRRVAAAASP
ncbi:hypothetical protein Mal4_19770 [Maioricimonas rarisocia]|uniref:Uncharacterized protein n=1 Tax=Maioricimonas rarisocia TaxID=2528026 RepID=A0A517Z594_9PLAN|nr:hypothetical protein [Maioricimonas rarisocia]QDU37662.1 hypothetical protein Mal4_19770 [Maioricimonas rarisocia]